MSTISGNIINLQKKIMSAKKELSELNILEQPLPEFINTTNMLRANEYLQKENEKKSQLLYAYEEYMQELENLVSNILTMKGNLNTLKSRLTKTNQRKRKIKRKKIHKKIKKKRTRTSPRSHKRR